MACKKNGLLEVIVNTRKSYFHFSFNTNFGGYFSMQVSVDIQYFAVSTRVYFFYLTVEIHFVFDVLLYPFDWFPDLVVLHHKHSTSTFVFFSNIYLKLYHSFTFLFLYFNMQFIILSEYKHLTLPLVFFTYKHKPLLFIPSFPDWVKPKTMKLVFVASPQSTQH